jgi:diguanylate cyclase (GGDEF)-like protein/PAS domain S-box-containing protein
MKTIFQRQSDDMTHPEDPQPAGAATKNLDFPPVDMTISPPALLRQLYESVTDFAILTTDRQSHITSWNAGARAIFGYETVEMLGASTATTFTEEDLAAGQPYVEMDVAAKHGRAADYRWHVRKDGSVFWADGVLTAVRDEDGNVTGFIKILRDITERKAVHDEVTRLATIDGLTGLYNRAAFDARRHELTAFAARSAQKLLLFMIDLDRFKEVNDTYGHQAGDRLLVEAGARIRAISRASDIVARIGGDEFALLQLNPTSPLLGATFAAKILDSLSQPYRLGSNDAYVSGSIGIAIFPDDAANADGLLKSADLALYAAKAHGRNCYHYFTEALDLIAHRRTLEQGELKRLERTKGFWVAYQPIVDATSGQPVAMEALLRVSGSILSNSNIDHIVGLAKESGLLPNIGAWVFGQACARLIEWRSGGLPAVKIAVNTCANELLNPEYVNRLGKVLRDFNLTPGDIDLELTERDAIELERSRSPTVQRLSEMGFGIVLDDFGTGYSSLSYLRSLPVTGLKLDKSFLKGVPDERDANAITRAVIALARDLGLTVTAEGVEHTAQSNFLRDAGCDTFQGFLFAQPMPAHDAFHWLHAVASSR